MMDERALEEKLDEMLAEAAKMAEEEPVDIDVKTTDDGQEIVFSKAHERRMKKIFKMAANYERSKPKLEREFQNVYKRAEKRHRKIAKQKRKATENELQEIFRIGWKGKRRESIYAFLHKKKSVIATFTAVFLLGMTMASTSGAWRKGVAKFLFKTNEEYSDFKNVKSSDNSTEVEGIKFSYIPRGFTFESSDEKFGTKYIMFSNYSEELFFDLKVLKLSRDIKVNTENSEVVDISTNERDMVLVKNENEMYVTWQDTKSVYVLDGNCDEKTLKTIAKNIKIIQE